MTDHDTAYAEGFDAAVREIAAGTASHDQAKERGLYSESQDARIEWDRGYAHAVCAYRLGHDVASMSKHGLRAVSTLDEAYVVQKLLDGTWGETRPDPRK